MIEETPIDAPAEAETSSGRRGRGAGAGAAARRAARSGGGPGKSLTYITRKIRTYEVLDEEGLALIEANADTILEEIGIEFRDDAEALALWKEAGADVKGERVHFPKGLPRSLLKTAPSIYTQHARNPERAVQIGGNATVFAPVTARPLCVTLMAIAAMQRLKTSTISSNLPIWRHPYITPVVPYANRSMYRSTSATLIWSMLISNILTSPSWGL